MMIMLCIIQQYIHTGDTDLQNLLGNMSQQQLMQLLGGMGGLSGLTSILGQSGGSSNTDVRPSSATSQDSSST